MQYFMYSPLALSESEAYQLAKPYLNPDWVVIVRNKEWIYYDSIEPGMRVQAYANTYLVRVELDGSLRTVQRNLI
jgi:hypothetical protein